MADHTAFGALIPLACAAFALAVPTAVALAVPSSSSFSLTSAMATSIGVAPFLAEYEAWVMIMPGASIATCFWQLFRTPASARSAVSLSQIAIMSTVLCFTTSRVLDEQRQAPPHGISLRQPLTGTIFVAQGGVTAAANHHTGEPAQRWAVDLIRPYSVGDLRAALEGRADKFAIFGSPVLAPCHGLVRGLRDDRADQALGSRDPSSSAGNFVVVQCTDTSPEAIVLLAHLRQGSVQVSRGQRVTPGLQVGEVGNSGNTTEPHLHVEAHTVIEGHLAAGDALPTYFDGRWLRKFDVLRARGPSTASTTKLR